MTQQQSAHKNAVWYLCFIPVCQINIGINVPLELLSSTNDTSFSQIITPRGFGEQLQPHSRAKNGNSHIMHHATIDPINTYRKGIKPSIFLLKRKDLRDEKHKYRYDVVPVDILKAALHRIDVKMHTRSF